jgi:hypothetical protein
VPDELPGPVEGQALIYATADGTVRVEVLFGAETFWLTINRMAELFGTTKQTISYHLRQLYESGELSREAAVKGILTVQREGARDVSRTLDYYKDHADVRDRAEQAALGDQRHDRHRDRRGRVDAGEPQMGLTSWSAVRTSHFLATPPVFSLDEALWLSQRGIAELFNASVLTLIENLQSVFDAGDLAAAHVRKSRITASGGPHARSAAISA